MRVLKLSDAFGGEADIEVQVTMRNVNYGKNQKLMESCKPLSEYAWLVDRVRKHQETTKNLETAVDKAIDECASSVYDRQREADPPGKA